jgi:autotransporter-associated beta strand protein
LFLDLNGFNQTVSTVAETAVGDSTIRFGNSSTNANSVLTVATPPGTTNTWAIRLEDDLENQLNYTNSLGLTVTSGLLALVNTNTYTGPTLITGGTLLLNIGTGLNAGRVGQLGETVVTVSGTGTLGGNGTIAGPVTVASGGTLSAGTSIGKLTINNTLDLQAGSRSVFELNVGNTNDQVVGISTLTCGGTLVVTNVGALPFADGNVFKLFDAASYVAGTMAVQPASPGPGLAWDTSKLAMDGTLRVVSLPPAPVIAGYGKLPDGNFAVTVNGENGRFYSLLATTNVAAPLNTWTVIQSAIQISSSVVLTDLGATNYPTRFYLISTP